MCSTVFTVEPAILMVRWDALIVIFSDDFTDCLIASLVRSTSLMSFAAGVGIPTDGVPPLRAWGRLVPVNRWDARFALNSALAEAIC